jgi:heterodisulfide reductase subunit B
MAAAALKNRIENLIAMAQLLERVDANPTLVGADQYRHLVHAVQSLLADADLPDDALRAVMRACPASAVLYENMHYDRSGLSQSPLDAAVASEMAAADLIAGLRARAH